MLEIPNASPNSPLSAPIPAEKRLYGDAVPDMISAISVTVGVSSPKRQYIIAIYNRVATRHRENVRMHFRNSCSLKNQSVNWEWIVARTWRWIARTILDHDNNNQIYISLLVNLLIIHIYGIANGVHYFCYILDQRQWLMNIIYEDRFLERGPIRYLYFPQNFATINLTRCIIGLIASSRRNSITPGLHDSIAS